MYIHGHLNVCCKRNYILSQLLFIPLKNEVIHGEVSVEDTLSTPVPGELK